MRVVETQVFQYAELSDKAKAKARDWYREASQGDNYFAESVVEDAVTCAHLLGIDIATHRERWVSARTGKQGETVKPKIYWSGFGCQGDGASFEGDYSAPDSGTALEAIKDHAPQDEDLHAIAARLDALQARYSKRLTADVTQSGRYVHRYTMRVEPSATNAAGDEIDVGANDAAELEDALGCFAGWIYRQMEQEYNYVNSDEFVAETIEANDYEFTADGERF